MRVKRILVTTIPALLIWLVCPAGVAALELSGQVVDGQGNPLNGAGVRVIQIPYLGAITDADGKFSSGYSHSDYYRRLGHGAD